MQKNQIIEMLLQTKAGQMFDHPTCRLASRDMALMVYDSYQDVQYRVVLFCIEGSPAKIFGSIEVHVIKDHAAGTCEYAAFHMRTNRGPFYFDGNGKKITKYACQRLAGREVR